ncbi:MAG: aspartyl-tRNA(Asn)/glutamyl-tRNA (Gln) amidotransferase subunit C [Candidatus Peregrinibacteria bacterium Greene0416_62]|nr:MAG: aspartyl-tRNA(Asn)/glutamyl-tRNA (Gln) amidotransferase subunit C [Candidatus Peregrinibacteria bacterium Greene0416_62]TSC98688.1 MAG: aspartyl-tRNA(Asn)/glutamyl-tRNA (Gln) amidotransferase subunit C [Candidatus Peregrinibacteria bacterium Greene1014_49]
MTTLSATQVRHIAKLARLEIGDEEVEKYAKELTAIFTYIEQLSEVDTSKVQATAQVTGTVNALREDIIHPSPIDREALLGTSPLPIVDDQIETPSAHG